MKPKTVILSVSLLITLLANGFQLSAESLPERESRRHEVRFGWGDQLFENLIWQNPQAIVDNLPESFSKTYKENYRYSQHWSAEYQWRANGWLGIGALVDASACFWDDVTRNGKGLQTDIAKGQNFWNLLIMPTARFSESDVDGKHTVAGFAANVELIGISVDWSQWFAYSELGGSFSLRNKSTIFLAASRIISIGIGFRF